LTFQFKNLVSIPQKIQLSEPVVMVRPFGFYLSGERKGISCLRRSGVTKEKEKSWIPDIKGEQCPVSGGTMQGTRWLYGQTFAISFIRFS
jgi:hypothetical protein